ncbi:rho-GTPase-activating protein Lrg1p [Monosporozyma unispora]
MSGQQQQGTPQTIGQQLFINQTYPNATNQVNGGTNCNNTTTVGTKLKICSKCNKPIYHTNKEGDGTLKALGKYYHEKCFTCYDCHKPLKPKFFPFQESPNQDPILLCQYHYFKRHDLLCKVCDNPLRGLYYTAFGGRYDEEHFSCTICKAPCGIKKCFMFDDQLYCKYHFLKYFSRRCKGCHYPISDQYIEFPKGNEIHCWHPECYGIHKYWHVNLSPETLGLPSIPLLKYDSTQQIQDVNPTSNELDKQMQAFTFILTKTWTVLYKFEEETASCISDMFQYLSSSEQIKGIESAALFVLKIECLFKGLDYFNEFNNFVPQNPTGESLPQSNAVQSTNDPNALQVKYKSLTRNLTTKIMIYLQLLRKLNSKSPNENVVGSFMSVITGLAHFLKLAIRYGFHTALENNKTKHSSTALSNFLNELEKNEFFDKYPFGNILIPINTTDNCTGCQKYIQEECIQFEDKRWHLQCFTCSRCNNIISPVDINDATYRKDTNEKLCFNCSLGDPSSVPGFKVVSRLAQLIFLLKIALVRSKAVMTAQLRQSQLDEKENSRDSVIIQQTYIRTLNDIKRLRSRRESVRISHNKQEARKSVILNTDEEDLNSNVKRRDSTGLIIETEKLTPVTGSDKSTNPENVFNNAKSLTLDDISRIVAAEQARELRPNAFTHFKKLKESDDNMEIPQKRSGVYYSELNDKDLQIVKIISAAILVEERQIQNQQFSKYLPVITKEKPSSGESKFWNSMKTAMGMRSKRPTPKKVFGTPLDVVTDKWGVGSDLGVGPIKIKIPIVLDELISSLRQMDMSVEGIFRKNGNIRRLRELTEMIDKHPLDIPDLSKENAIQLSALLKKWVRELPDPILTVNLYNLWIDAAKIESDVQYEKIMSLIYSLLPVVNRNTLEVILSFLYWTSSFSHIENEMGSKMDIHNLSTVIAPNILYLPEKRDAELTPKESYANDFAENEGQHHFLAIEITDYLIKHNEEIAIIPKFLYLLLNDVKSKFGLESIDVDKIRQYVITRVGERSIDYTEFDRQNSVRVKNSTTYAVQSENKRNNRV